MYRRTDMSVRFSFVVLTSVVLMAGFTGNTAAQSVVFTSSGYTVKQPAKPTISPYGTFAVGENMEGQYRVSVAYGTSSDGSFKPYDPVPNGVPASSTSPAQKIDAKGGVFDWIIDSANAVGVTKETQIQITLQQSTDGGKTWKSVGSPGLLTAIPSPPPQ